MSKRNSVVIYVVQFRTSWGWVKWSAHVTRAEAWENMRKAREENEMYPDGTARIAPNRFRVVPYMPEATR